MEAVGGIEHFLPSMLNNDLCAVLVCDLGPHNVAHLNDLCVQSS